MIWPSGKLPSDCQKIAKIAKSFTFFPQKLPKIFIFQKNCHWQFLKKMSSFWQFFDSQMAIFRRVSSELLFKYLSCASYVPFFLWYIYCCFVFNSLCQLFPIHRVQIQVYFFLQSIFLSCFYNCMLEWTLNLQCMPVHVAPNLYYSAQTVLATLI